MFEVSPLLKCFGFRRRFRLEDLHDAQNLGTKLEKSFNFYANNFNYLRQLFA